MSSLKKLKYILCFMTLILIFTGCNRKNNIENVKTTFKVNEEAKLNNISIVLNDLYEIKNWKDIEREHDTYLIFEFKITNTGKSNVDINSFANFKLYIDGVLYYDLNNSSTAIIQQDKSLIYQIVYDVPDKDSYELNFTSGDNSNNIKFVTE